MQYFRAVICNLLVLSICGCAVVNSPSLERLYAQQAGNPDQPPVVFVHGTLGSRLIDSETGQEAWPGSLRKILFSDYRAIRLDIDGSTLTPMPSKYINGGIAERAAGKDFYGRILRTLEQAGGYQPGEVGTTARARGSKSGIFLVQLRVREEAEYD